MVTGFWELAIPAFLSFRFAAVACSRDLLGLKSQLLLALRLSELIPVKPFVYFMLVHILCSEYRVARDEEHCIYYRASTYKGSARKCSLNGGDQVWRRCPLQTDCPTSCTDPYHILLGFPAMLALRRSKRVSVSERKRYAEKRLTSILPF